MFCATSRAVDLNSLFSDNVVLQQNKPLPIWGTGRDGEKISVQLGERTATTTVSGGKWSVKLDALPAGGPLLLTVIGDNTLTVTNVLIGEVWVCSGQSNMERQLGPRSGQKPLENWEQEVDAAEHPQIRMFFVHVAKSAAPLADAHSKWAVCSPQTAINFSAVGYFFAQALQSLLNVPVGMMFTSVGRNAIELGSSLKAPANSPAGTDKRFVPVKAVIEGETMAVSSRAVSAPVAARYHWAGVAEGNLYNAADLLASPFRTEIGSGHE